MSGWKARIGYLSPSVFETPSDWDLILPKGFTIVASGLNVQAHTETEFNKAIDALGAGLGIFAAEECDVILMGGITLGTQRGYVAEQAQHVVERRAGRSSGPEFLIAERSVPVFGSDFPETTSGSLVATSAGRAFTVE